MRKGRGGWRIVRLVDLAELDELRNECSAIFRGP